MLGKKSYLKKITSKFHIPSVEVGRELDGSTPPSVFIGSWNYPKVYAGPMITPLQGDTSIMDMPEAWIASEKSQEDIISFRLNLVRGKQLVKINNLENNLIEKLQEISLATNSIDSEAEFGKKPRGFSLSDQHAPHGPSAVIERFDIDSVRWDRELEKVFYDTDHLSKNAIIDLHKEEIPFSQIQKAFSVGTMGVGKRRKLVPTRWSITACDTTIADHLLKKVKHYPVLDSHRVYEYRSLNNYYAVILTPTPWQYEWMEAFLHVLGREEIIFSDFENYNGKKEYSRVGGCYYTCKMAVLEHLEKIGKQSGVIVLREAYSDYIPLGVFNVRENIRNAMNQPYKEFEDIKTALEYINQKLKLSTNKFIETSDLLQDIIKSRQTTLDVFY